MKFSASDIYYDYDFFYFYMLKAAGVSLFFQTLIWALD